MSRSDPKLNDAELAAHMAQTAGRLLIELRASGLFSPKALGKAGDATANQFLVHAIREARPDDSVLSEEMKCDGARLGQTRVWIIDPVDGTREYGFRFSFGGGTTVRMLFHS